ncbi:MAG TPA: heat-inducible transcription repressor HrcA [Ruminiclostridium sp.]|nr:heat-inducible transcription repressor HrcA [Ruminiclostridium sp.]
MIWDNELNDRKRAILRSIINDYIQSAQPVGSRTIARKHELGLGSATIRNEMADLEELGYITQPHTSAGRIPSDKGYRFYVEHLMEIHSLEREEMVKIKEAMEERIDELNQLFRRASIIISSITGYTSVVMTPQLKRAAIKSVQLVHVDEKRTLVVVVAGIGVVQNKLVKHDYVLNDDTLLQKLSAALNSIMTGKTIDEITVPMITELQHQIKAPDQIVYPVLQAVGECVRKIESTEVYTEGIINILNHPEFSDLLKAREILELLKEEDILADLVKGSPSKHHFDFKIGSENEINQLKDLSIITTVYGREGQDLGTIGVIGPTRMAYGKVVSAIQYMRDLLDREIIRIFGDNS